MTSLPIPSIAPRDAYAGISAMLVAEPGDRRERAAEVLAAAGVRVRAQTSFGEAPAWLDEAGGLDLIVIEAAAAPDALLDAVLARADAMVREQQLCAVVSVSLDQLDAAAARLFGPRVQLLCNPGDADRTAAIALACALAAAPERPAYLLPVRDDARHDGETARLQRLNEEVARIAETLVRLTRGEEFGGRREVREPGTDYRTDAGEPEAATPSEIRAAIRARRMRAQFFAGDLFADPAWDMLLDLFAAQLEDRSVSVSSLCIAAAVPPTTALRWIATLHAAGLFERRADPADRRRAYIALSPSGLAGMREYVAAVKRAGLNLV